MAVALLVLLPLAALAAAKGTRAPIANNPHGSFKEACELCHTAKGWKPAQVSPKFDHAKYGFTLDGAHAAAGCLSCHASIEFAKPERQCASCHEDPHQGEFGADCSRCHGARSFIDHATMVRAHQMTRFPLSGAHAGLDCAECHRGAEQGHLRFIGAQSECISCHRADFDAATNPDHRGGGFSQNCLTCHSASTWQPARFNHDHTAFPLTGAHRTAACASCHAGGSYAGTATDCVSCHRNDYDATTNPVHSTSGFTTQCQTCHSTSGWDGASFDHDARFFPIYSGRHAGEWDACADCHTNPSNYHVFTCLSCHPHSDQPETDGHHRGESGYQYTSASCYSCHPRGRS
jgi:hypothetical protein